MKSEILQASVITRRTMFKGAAATAVLLPSRSFALGSSSSDLVVVAGSQISSRFAVATFPPSGSPSVVLVPTDLTFCQVAIDNTLIAVGSLVGGKINFYDVSNPAQPALLSSVNTGFSGIGALSVRGTIVAAGELINSYQARVCLIDLSARLSPNILATVQTPFFSLGTSTSDGTGAAIASIAFLTPRVLVASGQTDFFIAKIDFSNLSSPAVSTFLPHTGNPPFTDASGPLNLIAAGDSGGGQVKFFNATTEQLLATVSTGLLTVDSIALSDSVAVAGSIHSPMAVKINIPAFTTEFFLPLPSNFGASVGLNGRLCVTGSPFSSYISITDLSSQPVVLGSCDVVIENIASVGLSLLPISRPVGRLGVSSSAINFGGVSVGSEAHLDVTVTNTGNAPLRLGSTTLSNNVAFQANGALGSTLLPGQSSVVNIYFSPKNSGPVQATLVIAALDSSVAPVSVGLSGSGVLPAPSVINGTFETGYLHMPWQIYAPASGFSANVYAGAGHSGRYGLEQTGTTGLVYQDVSGLTYGLRYDVMAWIKISPGATATAKLTAHDTLGGNYVESVPVNSKTAASWIQLSISFKTDSTQKVRIHLVDLGGNGACYWDDVQIYGSIFA